MSDLGKKTDISGLPASFLEFIEVSEDEEVGNDPLWFGVPAENYAGYDHDCVDGMSSDGDYDDEHTDVEGEGPMISSSSFLFKLFE